MAPTIVTRAQWGARAPKGAISTTTWGQRVGVAIHHSAGPTTQTVRAIQDYQMDSNGWVDIGYNWLVTQDGRLWEGRQGTWLAIGAHAANQNTAWVGVCWIGTSGSTAPSPAALSTLRWVWEEAQRRAGRRLLVSGHGQLPGQATECPGSRLRVWIAAGLPVDQPDGGIETMFCKKGDKGNAPRALQLQLRRAGFDPGAIDGDYGAATAAAVLAMRKAAGSSATSGDTYDGWGYDQLSGHLLRKHAGKDGTDGEDGQDGRTPTAAEIQAATVAWLDAHKDELHGEPGLTPTKITFTVTATGNVTEAV